jgi:hypothetical protein
MDPPFEVEILGTRKPECRIIISISLRIENLGDEI